MAIEDGTITTGGTNDCGMTMTVGGDTGWDTSIYWTDDKTNVVSLTTENPKPSKPKGDQPMETLYNVIVVSKDRDVFLDTKVIAVDVDEAKLLVDINPILKDTNLKPRDLTILVIELGEVKVRKEVQKVKVVDKDEE